MEQPVRRAFELDWENSWVGTTRICLSFTPPPFPPPFLSKMFPQTAKSSSVPGHQQPSRKKTKQSFGVFRSRVASFSGLFVCSFFFVAKVDVWTESVLFPFPPLSPTCCWIYQPVSRGFEISTINSAFNPFQLDGTEPKVAFYFLQSPMCPLFGEADLLILSTIWTLHLKKQQPYNEDRKSNILNFLTSGNASK